MKIAFSWDDGALEDIRLFELHRKYNIPSIFFVPTKNIEGREVLTKDIILHNADELISFGSHTQSHIYLTKIPMERIESEITDNKKYLEDILQREIEHFCYPGGAYNDQIIKIVHKYFKTSRTADTMYFKKPEKSMLKPSFHFYPRGIKSIIGNGIRNGSYTEVGRAMKHCKWNYFNVMKNIIEMESHMFDRYVVVWGHSWEIEAKNLWKELDSLFSFIRNEYAECVVDYNEIFTSD